MAYIGDMAPLKFFVIVVFFLCFWSGPLMIRPLFLVWLNLFSPAKSVLDITRD